MQIGYEKLARRLKLFLSKRSRPESAIARATRSVGETPTPICGTGFQPVQRGTDSRVRALGLGQDCPSHSMVGRDAQATSRLRRRDADTTDWIACAGGLGLHSNSFSRAQLALPALLTLCLLTLSACGRRGGAPAPQAQASEAAAVSVAVAKIRTGTLVETASVTGELQSYNDVTVATKLGGRIVEVRVLEGDRVRKGEIIAIQDQTDLQLQLRQAEAAMRAAEANLRQAEIAARTQPAQTEAQIQAAKAALEAARARLRALQSGARPQERQQAEQAVAAARANFELAKANYERAQQLYQQGAIPKQQLDSAKTAFEAAQAQLRQAEETLSLVREGPRREDIEAAEQAVRQAEEAYRQALLGKAQNELARQRVDAARAALQQARAQVALLRQQIADTVIRAPFDGVVANRFAEVGAMAGAGTPVVRIVTVDRLYFEATLPEVLLRDVKVGMPVQVRVDAFPNRVFAGRVEAIYPVVADQARNLRLRISLTNPADLPLKAGLFARGEIRLREYKNVPLTPKLALIEKGGETRVFVVQNGVAKQRRLRVVATNTEVIYAEGVQVGETVVVRGQDLLSDGQPVRVIEQ